MKTKLKKLVLRFEKRLIRNRAAGVETRINYSIFDEAVKLVKNQVRFCGHQFDFHVLLANTVAEISPMVADYIGDMDEHAIEEYCSKRGYSFDYETPGFKAQEVVYLAGRLGIAPSDKEKIRELVYYIFSQQMAA